MAQITPCCLPKFVSGSDQPARPMSLRIQPNPSDDARLLSAWRDRKLSAVIKVTWGLILRCYMDSGDVCFGYRSLTAAENASKGVSPNSLELTTVRLAIGDGDFASTLVDKAQDEAAVDASATHGGRNVSGDGYQLYNTVVLIRSYVGGPQGTAAASLPSALALTLPKECLIRLHVKVLGDSIRIFLEWRNNEMSLNHVKGISALLQNTLTRVLSPEATTVGDLDSFTEQDWHRISAWNGPSPQVYNRCIHDIIREQVLRRPHAEALCAWDGSLSYKDFDHKASRLAYHLQKQGVGPEVLVPLCFDKSMWYFVAVLAVLKAGGAFVPLDPSHPPARLQSLVKKVNARIILCSEWHADRLLGMAEVVIPLSQSTFDRISLAPAGFISSDEVNCSNAAYVIFTSGSTGEPKGTLLEHRAYCSSAMVHGPRLLIFPESRVLQFAAHTFDASLAESISPFMHGACVCVPSEADRLNDTVGAIKRLRANYASLTPSFIEFLEPSMVPEIQTLILAGEAMSESHRAKWSTINLVNGFGPTEASVTAAINSKVTATTDCKDIGRPLNTRCWIVNPENHDHLVPVGAIGEMLLEGPTLARGYINNPQKTAEAFIFDPGFVNNEPVASQGRRRFYKTGDLVRYNGELGSLTYIGRKDTQVKLHGQRVELGEIEGCLTADPLVKHCVVLLPKEGYAEGKLSAVISLNRDNESSCKPTPLGLIATDLHQKSVMQIREQLSSRLPTYMIPAAWVCVNDMPFLPSRKLDRKGILNWLARLDRDPYRTEISGKPSVAPELPANEAENHLIQVWSHLLNLSIDQIPLDESFLRLGGDSIAAMTCMHQCKKLGIAVTVQDILRSSSVKELASRARETSSHISAGHQETLDTPFDLSPIQALHFKLRREGQGYFNQSIMTCLNRHLDPKTLHSAVETLVRKHSMLRARFAELSDGIIQQRITDDVAGSYHWCEHRVDSEDAIESIVASSQLCLSSYSGPLLAVNLINVPGKEQVLSMVAHHLVVDIVSWRVLLEDLEEILLNPPESLAQNSSLPFQTWLQLQADNSQNLEKQQPELENLPSPDFAFWGLAKQQIIYGDVNCASFSLDETTTSLLMTDAHNSLRTEPVDILLAAMLHTFGQTFPERSLPVIYNEGHGREPWDACIDISRTVGWFTTLYPILIEKTRDSIDAIVRVKDRRRQVNDNGRSLFTRRALPRSGTGHYAHDYPMEINLNYLGQQRDLQRPDSLFRLAAQMAGETREGGGAADFGKETPRFSLFEISAAVVAGKLRFVFSFSKSMKHQDRIQEWVDSCQQLLRSLATQLPILPSRPTISDFPLLALSYPELGMLATQKLPRYGIRSMDLVEDIYPCSKMQQGVLLSQARDPLLYAVSGTWEVQAGPGAPVPEVDRLVAAWNRVVEYHDMLRTIFATGLSRHHPFSHIVLKEFHSTPEILRCLRDEDILPALNSQSPADYRATRPPHRFSICQSATGKIICKLELSHAAMDGSSVSLLLRDMQRAYAGTLSCNRKPAFKDYIAHLQRQPARKGIEYWCSYVADLQPCRIPSDVEEMSGSKSLRSIRLSFTSFDKLQALCAEKNITVANAFNAAWALTVGHFSGLDEVCFSYTASLRDASVPGIDAVIGPAMNLVLCRLKLGRRNLDEILRQVQEDYIDSLPYRDTSLIDIQHAMKISKVSLFNTGVSYRKLPAQDRRKATIQFKGVGLIHDPAEVSVYVNIEATDAEAELELNYWSNWLSDGHANRVAEVFLKSLTDIASSSVSKPSTNRSLSRSDIDKISKWNALSPKQSDSSIHTEIENQVARTPDSVAVVTTGRDISYAKLNGLSSSLADYLVNLGILPGTAVPISFDDTIWALISILAVWKAGGSCIPLEPSFFNKDIEAWLMQADVQVALASPSRAPSLEEITPYVIPVDGDLFDLLASSDTASHKPQPADTAFVIFPAQSGRGLVLDHGAIITTCQSFAASVGVNSNTRVLQTDSYTSYNFLFETFGTLTQGGCVCIPSTEQMADFAISIRDLHPTTISVKSPTSMLVNSGDFSTIGQVILYGETATQGVELPWARQAEIHVFYGDSEYSPVCIHRLGSKPNLGSKTFGVNTWVVDPSDHNLLLPLGAIGELVIEGPVLARGYLYEASTEKFIEDPKWLSLLPGRGKETHCRMYKTGTLVQYAVDGSLLYRGCKGQQLLDHSAQGTDVISQNVLSQRDYWEQYLAGAEACHFPSLADGLTDQDNTSCSRIVIDDVENLRALCQSNDISPSAVFQLSWAAVLRCYTGLLDVCYGFSEGNQDDILPFTLALKDDRQIKSVLTDIESSIQQGESHRKPLADILGASTNRQTALFNTVLYLSERKGSSAKRSSHFRGISKTKYFITVRAEVSKTACVVEFMFLEESLPETYADAIAVCFEHVLEQIVTGMSSDKLIRDIDFLDEHTGSLVQDWNRSLPERCERCVHDLIAEQTRLLPRAAPAICAWDGNFTYSQLDTTSTRLAQHLQCLGVGPEVFVALCFNKSAWTVVAQLAVLKAGGAFASLDPAHPEGRLRGLVADLGATIILTCAACYSKASNLGAQPFIVSQSAIDKLPRVSQAIRGQKATHSNAAYAIFTSGTTGMPKATVLEHTALSSTALQLAKYLGLNSTTRTLQFSSYTFDVSVLDIHGTLINGGCVCVPSDNERVNDLAGAIRRMGVTHWNSTPGIANTTDPKTIPSLATIVTGGEKMSPGHIERWSDRCVINAYGPSETTIIATVSIKVDREGRRSMESRGSIGNPTCGRAWVVDPYNPQRLLPVGATGELVLEGCNVARGYLNNEEKTKKFFISHPKWSSHDYFQDTMLSQERMYRTGDLVRYNPDGTLTFISRMDTQVKLNGQRIELEEIEIQCIQALPTDSQVVVDIISPQSKGVRSLAVFFSVPGDDNKDNDNDLLLSMTPLRNNTATHIWKTIQETLPQYMVPNLFFSVAQLPCNTSAKIDRRRLREMAESLSKQQLKPYSSATFSIIPQGSDLTSSPSISSSQDLDSVPTLSSKSSLNSLHNLDKNTVAPNIISLDSKLRSLWGEVLCLEPSTVSTADNFFALGGDSFTAMSLVSVAQAEGLALSVAEIFQNPTLEAMVSCCEVFEASLHKAPAPPQFALLPTGTDIGELLDEITTICSVAKGAIYDIYPCSALQGGLITASIQQPGAYVAHPVFRLAQGIDLAAFKAAWQMTVDEIEVLRTRIIHTAAANFVQVVFEPSPIQWGARVEQIPAHVGGALTGYTITQSENYCLFTWSIHHALYDGWSIPLVLRKVEKNYEYCRNGTVSSPSGSNVPYSLFIDHLQQRDLTASGDFWRTYLANMSSPAFPASKKSLPTNIQASSRHRATMKITPNSTEITLPTLIRAAWALILSLHTENGDVCFGETLMGRNISLPGAANIAGPMLTTVPTRIAVDHGMTVVDYLQRVHQSGAEMIPYQHAGLQEIRRLSTDTAAACEFQNLLVIQTAEKEMSSTIWSPESTETNHEFFTYPLTVECRLADSIEITTFFDDTVISGWKVQRLVAQLTLVLSQLAATSKSDSRHLSDLDLICSDDQADLSKWNKEFAPTVNRTIHDLISDQRLLRPDSPSVASWDGNLTYEELVSTATTFASQLSALGVGPEVLVPMCMDKSVWMILSIMGIMIAGGGFVPLDPAHPTSRHEEILEETGARIVLCTPKYRSRYTGKVPTVLGVDQNTTKQWNTGTGWINPHPASSANVAYSIFTSGSTGRPKGIIIEHRAFASSTMAYGPIIHLKPGIRVFQFASLTFDAAVMEILGTLIYGGCVCIPSDEDRLNDVAGAIRRFNASWLFCTPSLASIMEPSSVPSLKVMVCGGEMMSHEAMTKWSDRVKFINAYGPTETSVYATFNTNIGRDRNPACIGKPIPSTLPWIVDPENADRLYPIGVVGELALEGPVLAREYLKNPEKTSNAFINNPKWTQSPQTAGSPRRIYLTGDLARFTPDGNLEYVGRKDHQVKLHGQRMELGEIEYRLHEHAFVRHVVVILPKTGRLQKRLVCILSLNSLSTETSLISSADCSLVDADSMQKQGMAELMAAQSSLESQLPPYMVPQTWAVINTLPMLVSGKIDRKKITAWVEAVDDSTYNRIMGDYDQIKRGEVTTSNVSVEPKKDDSKSLLQDILVQVLNIPPEKLEIDRSFTSLGGDSITGMAVVSHARKKGLTLSLHKILQCASIKELAQSADAGVKKVRQTEKPDTWFDLSAIQSFYFQYAYQHKGSARFNQSVTLQLSQRVEARTIQNALKAITARHAMLRARFTQSGGKWQQIITPDVDSSYRFRVLSVQSPDDMKRAIYETQTSIDIQGGPAFAVDFFDTSKSGQVLFVVASHLCVDMVSWRLIMQDLEDYIKTGSLTCEKPLPFQSWCDMQLEHCKKEDYRSHLPFTVVPADSSYWGIGGSSNCYGDVRIKKFELGIRETALALDKCHARLRTEPLDLFLAVVVHSFWRTFTDRQLPTVYNETHGREAWDPTIDLSGTVGWFTSICPLHLDLASDDILDTLRKVKDVRRKIVNKGMSYFAQQILCPEKQGGPSAPAVPVELVFNYLGKLQQLERDDSLFKHFGNAYDEKDFTMAGDMGPETPRFAFFEISAIVIRNQLQFAFTFSKKMNHQAQISRWISECETTLYAALDALMDKSQLEVTPSDYPLLSISQNSLQTLFTETLPKLGVHSRDEVEDIYPCSPMQEGIMFSQLRDPAAYMLHTIFDVRDNKRSQPVNIPRLRKAWQMVVNRHPILRSIFVDSNSKDGSFDQVVLKHLHADVVELEGDDTSALEQLGKVSLEEMNRRRSTKLLHQLTVCKTPEGNLLMKLEMNHAIIDGSSVGILLRDFSLAYDRQLSPQSGPLYRDYIQHMRSHPQVDGVAFWKEYLHGIRPCRLPSSSSGPRKLKSVKMDFHRFSELRQLSQRESITIANLILAGWALVLREFTGSSDVCFGYLSAGRDAPAAGIQEAVGIFINMLCCRVQFTSSQSYADVYKTVQNDFFHSIPYQSCSLAKVQNELGLSSEMLFNTALSIQNQMPSAGSRGDALSFEIQKAYDPSEFPITVNVVTAQGGEGILLRYWSDVVSSDQAQCLAASMARVFTTFIEGSSRLVSASTDSTNSTPFPEQKEQTFTSQTSLRRQSSVRSRHTKPSLDDPSIQEQIDQRVHQILSQILNKNDMAAVNDLTLKTPRDSEVSSIQDDLPTNNEAPISPTESIRRRFSVISRVSRRRMSMDLERKLLVLWAAALDVPADLVNRQDSFFRVGGDSIKAMKMASAAREEGLVLTVADVFRNPIFEDMLTVICSTNIVHAAPTISEAGGTDDDEEYDEPIRPQKVQEIIPSGAVSCQTLELAKSSDLEAGFLQADICPKIGFFKGGISDVLPVTDFQALSLTAQLFESRWMLNYFYLDGEGQLDLKRLRESCARAVDAFDILRTVFVCSGNHFYQVILKKVRPSIVIYETHTDLDTFTASLQQRDRDQGLQQGEQFVQFIVAKRRGTNQNRLLIRLSHAQYDGMCISKILDAIKQGYEGGTLPPTMSFANYMRLLPSSITPEHYEYWTKMLQGSRMTDVVARKYPNTYQYMGGFAEVKTTINIAQNSTVSNITVGTLVQAAWALTLAKLASDSDVVFGLTVNGRNASIPGVQDTVGPCLNMIPVRVTFGPKWTGLDLIRYLQDQLVATMPYESLGFREIIQRCTDWPCGTYFSTAVLHQNVEYEGQMELDNTNYRVGGAGVIDNLADFTLVSKSVGSNQVSLSLGYSSKGPITEGFASRALQMVCDTLITLTSNPTAQLPSPNTLRSLPPQTVPDLPRESEQELITSQLKSQNISEILVHSAILSRTWQQVLPSMYTNQKTFQLDTSFFDLGGDLFALGQATWLLQQEGYQVRIEDLLASPTFLGHMAVLAQHIMDSGIQDDIITHDSVSTPVSKTEKKVRWKKAFGIMGKFSKRESVSA